MYRNDWHQFHKPSTSRSADKISALLAGIFSPSSVLDLGCGHGDWLKAFADHGASDIFGCDGPWNDTALLEIPASSYCVADFRLPLDLGRRFDLVMSTEVAEHLEPAYAEDFVSSLVAHGDVVLFGAAIPYQGGFKHVNERWPSWWAGLFQKAGYLPFDIVRPAVWNDPGMHFWYKQNTLVYVNGTRDDLLGLASAAVRDMVEVNRVLDLVHPNKYEDVATYRSIAFRPFLRNFGGALGSKIRSMVSQRTIR